MILNKHARALAVEYASYCMAQREDDSLGIIVWGGMLIKTQRETNIQLASEHLITALIRKHSLRIHETQQED